MYKFSSYQYMRVHICLRGIRALGIFFNNCLSLRSSTIAGVFLPAMKHHPDLKNNPKFFCIQLVRKL